MSAAPPTTKIAVTQNTRSQLRSIHLYGFCRSALSSSRFWISAASAMAATVPASVAMPPLLFQGLFVHRRNKAKFPFKIFRLVRHDVWSELGACIGRFLGLFDLEQAQNGLPPHGEHPAREPPVNDERPMERYGEDLLGDPQAMAPFIGGDRHAFQNGGADQQKEGPGETLVCAVERRNTEATVEVGAYRQHGRKRKEEVEHGNVRRSQRGVAHHGLMPGAVPVRPEAGFHVDRQATDPHDAPQNGDSPNLFRALTWLADHRASCADQPSEPSAGKHAQGDQFAPEQ